MKWMNVGSALAALAGAATGGSSRHRAARVQRFLHRHPWKHRRILARLRELEQTRRTAVGDEAIPRGLGHLRAMTRMFRKAGLRATWPLPATGKRRTTAPEARR